MTGCWVNHFADWSRPAGVPAWAVASTLEVLRYAAMPFGQVLVPVAVVGAVRLGSRDGTLLTALAASRGLALVAAIVGKYPTAGPACACSPPRPSCSRGPGGTVMLGLAPPPIATRPGRPGHPPGIADRPDCVPARGPLAAGRLPGGGRLRPFAVQRWRPDRVRPLGGDLPTPAAGKIACASPMRSRIGSRPASGC